MCVRTCKTVCCSENTAWRRGLELRGLELFGVPLFSLARELWGPLLGPLGLAGDAAWGHVPYVDLYSSPHCRGLASVKRTKSLLLQTALLHRLHPKAKPPLYYLIRKCNNNSEQLTTSSN
eukprot:3382680-Amphidinium_carterae.1